MMRKIVPAFGIVLLAAGCGASTGTGSTASVTDGFPASPSAQASVSASAVEPAPVDAPSDSLSPEAPTPDSDSPSPVVVPTTPNDVPTTPDNQQASVDDGARTLDCSELDGVGTFTDPLQLGAITGPTVAEGCAPMTPGYGFNARYFSFTLTQAPGSDAYAGASFVVTDDALGPVYPQIDSAGGWILMDALTNGYWTGDDPYYTGRYQDISGLNAGTYIMLEEKMDSPEHSMTTPSFNAVVDPDYS